MQGMTPSVHKRHQIERDQHAREAQELSERTRLKRAAAKHVIALWNTALADKRFESAGRARHAFVVIVPGKASAGNLAS